MENNNSIPSSHWGITDGVRPTGLQYAVRDWIARVRVKDIISNKKKKTEITQ